MPECNGKPKNNKRYKILTDHIKLVEQVRNFVVVSVKEGQLKELISSRLLDAEYWLREYRRTYVKNT
jgi:hypothetical protein